MILDANPAEVDYAELERKQDLTILSIMEKVPDARKRKVAKALGLSWDEYERLQRKYRVVLDRYREEQSDPRP